MSTRRRSLVSGQARRDRREKKDGTGRTTTSRDLALGADLLKNVAKDQNGFDDLDEVFGDLDSDGDAGDVLELTMDTTVNTTMETTPAPPPSGQIFTPSVMGSVSSERRSTRKRKEVSPVNVSKFPGAEDSMDDFQDGGNLDWDESAELVVEEKQKPAPPKKQTIKAKSRSKGGKGKGVGRKTMLIIQEGGFLPSKEDYQQGRRSKRTKFPPRKYWTTEAPKYKRRASGAGQWLPEIKEISEMAEGTGDGLLCSLSAPMKKSSKRKKKTSKGKIKAPPSDSEEDDDQEERTPLEPAAMVLDASSENEVLKVVAKCEDMVSMETLNQVGDGAKIPKSKLPRGGKMFDSEGWSSGLLKLPPDSMKQRELAHMTEIFYIASCPVDGLEVDMHETSLLLSKGDSFIVPKGNVYRLRNRSKSKEIKLYFILINQPEVEEE